MSSLEDRIAEEIKNIGTLNFGGYVTLHVSNWSKDPWDDNDRSPYGWDVDINNKGQVLGIKNRW